MRDLNEIVTRNAKFFIADATSKAEKEGRRLTMNAIGSRMGEIMGIKGDTARKAIERCLKKPDEKGWQPWTADYIQGLALSIGRTVAEMVEPRTASTSKVSEATIAEGLYTALNHRMTPKEARDVIRRLHRQLDHRPLFDLVQSLTDRILDAETRDQAYDGVYELVRKSHLWDSKRRDLRGKKLSDG